MSLGTISASQVRNRYGLFLQNRHLYDCPEEIKLTNNVFLIKPLKLVELAFKKFPRLLQAEGVKTIIYMDISKGLKRTIWRKHNFANKIFFF